MVTKEMMRGSGHDDSLCINVVVATARNSNSVRSGTYTGVEVSLYDMREAVC